MEWIMAFIGELFIGSFRWMLIDLPGGTLRWLFAGRKRRWKEFLSKAESFDNFRAVLLTLLAVGSSAGIIYLFLIII